MKLGYGLQKNTETNFSTVNTDKDLEMKVYSALHTNCFLQSEAILVTVFGRRVYLEGTVKSEIERKLAQECIADIFGIRAITNYITFRHR